MPPNCDVAQLHLLYSKCCPQLGSFQSLAFKPPRPNEALCSITFNARQNLPALSHHPAKGGPDILINKAPQTNVSGHVMQIHADVFAQDDSAASAHPLQTEKLLGCFFFASIKTASFP